MLRFAEVSARVAIFRRIAAAHMAALQAHAQMYPAVTRFQAVLASFGRWFYWLDVILDMPTRSFRHGRFPFTSWLRRTWRNVRSNSRFSSLRCPAWMWEDPAAWEKQNPNYLAARSGKNIMTTGEGKLATPARSRKRHASIRCEPAPRADARMHLVSSRQPLASNSA